jgi:hypothetical protein
MIEKTEKAQKDGAEMRGRETRIGTNFHEFGNGGWG